ncbi:hypothetical protein TKK_0000689 [Trichogramma kaykai]
MDFPLGAFLAVQRQVGIESSDNDDDESTVDAGEISMDSDSSEGETDDDDDDDDSYRMHELDEESLQERLNRAKITSIELMLRRHDWDDPRQRKKIYRLICPIFRHWRGEPPDLLGIFEACQIQWLLVLAARDRTERGTRFVEFVARTGYKDRLEFRGQDGRALRNTPVHLANDDPRMIRALFEIYDRTDVNYVDQDGYTHFHAACKAGLLELVEKFLDNGVDPDCPGYEDPPLYMAINNDRRRVVELLLARGADPNAAGLQRGSTALHIVCLARRGREMLGSIFELSQDRHKPLPIDAKDRQGRTALHLALCFGGAEMAELLLRRGADPRLANNDGQSPLHLSRVARSTEMLFRVCDELGEQLEVDATDRWGKTPLRYAVSKGLKEEAKLLLNRGANANFVSGKGSTLLHAICERSEDDGLAKAFFDEARQTIDVDTKDGSGETALDLAAKNLLPNVLEVLLARGADLASFVFPPELKLVHKNYTTASKLRVGSGALGVYENLEKRGYEMKLNDALAVMRLFDKHGLFATRETGLVLGMATADEEFEAKAREISIKPDLSLYDSMRMPASVAAAKHRVGWSDGYELARHEDDPLRGIEKIYRKACEVHLCETISRGFFREWTELCFQELVSNRRWQLPIEVCEMIVRPLDNLNLYNICLAVELERNSK